MNRKGRSTIDDSETESDVENALNNNIKIQKLRRVRNRIISSSEEEYIHTELEETSCEIMDWSYQNLRPQIHKFKSNGMKVKLNRFSSALDYFQLFFSEELVQFIVERTNMYRNYRMDTSLLQKSYEGETTLNEIYQFLVIRLLMSRKKVTLFRILDERHIFAY